MVLINAPRGAGFKRRRQQQQRYNRERLALGLTGFVFVVFFVYTALHPSSSSNKSGASNEKLRHVVDANHPSLDLEDPQAAENTDFFDVLASDILQTLNCHTLLASETAVFRNGDFVYGIKEDYADEQRRRLSFDPDEGAGDDFPEDDRVMGGQELDDDIESFQQQTARVTAAHLFCLAAFPAAEVNPQDETAFWHDKIQCQVRGDKQQAILDLWSTARAEIPDNDILLKTLSLATENSITLLEHDLNVWAPPRDEGTEYMVQEINSQAEKKKAGDEEYGGIAGLADNLGEGRLYVDVGSGLGYTAMAIAILYPGTEIVSIEAAPTNWLLQELNWRCNNFHGHGDDHSAKKLRVVLAGVGPSAITSQLAKFVWRPTATTSTRAWSLSTEEHNSDTTTNSYNTQDDMVIPVRLRPWHLLIAEADVSHRKIDVLNVDCEGCEYNLIPSLKPQEFESISTIMGQMHWGYIPTQKLPSSERGKNTHERLCAHENFARTSIECCAFPDLTVRSSFSGETLVMEGDTQHFPPKEVTVKDLAGELCERFDEWAQEHSLFTIDSDVGWFEVAGSAR